MSYFADQDVYRRFEKHNYVLSFIYCHGICVYIVFSLLIALLMRLAIILPADVLKKIYKGRRILEFITFYHNALHLTILFTTMHCI